MKELGTVSILGCGWFGFPLAKVLLAGGYTVMGSTTTADKLLKLAENNINGHLIHLPLNGEDKAFFRSEILVLNIPPKKKPEEFITNIKSIIPALKQVKHVLFVSSTAVYGDCNSAINETEPLRPETASGKALAEVENMLKAQPDFTTTIVRFAGLVGPGRHPGKFLAGKKNIANGLAPINLIHLDDCVALVCNIISQKAFGHIFNACSPSHPTRKEFYTSAARALALAEPEFIEEKARWKVIESNQSSTLLNYHYKIDDWMKWLIS